MPQQKIIQQGAEAIIYLVSPNKKSSPITGASQGVGGRGAGGGKSFIIKDRISKSYRIPELDKKIRKKRTKSETKLLIKASEIINSPKPLETKEFDKIKMPYIKGKKLSEHLDNFSLKKQKEICKIIGQEIAKLHDKDIIHGDLTTSNMILVNEINKFEKQLNELKKLNLQKEEYAIFGSGPLAIRGIRESQDIDIIVKPRLWNKLSKKYSKENDKLIKIGSIEIYKNWVPWFKDINKIIEDADTFEGIRFAKLKYVLAWKKAYNREKDKKDIQLIKEYQKRGENNFPSPRVGGLGIIYFIDFGLGYISRKFEDKAVDLHLLKQALEAKHFKNWKELIKEVEKGYKKSKDSKIVLERLKAVEKRGRYKH